MWAARFIVYVQMRVGALKLLMEAEDGRIDAPVRCKRDKARMK